MSTPKSERPTVTAIDSPCSDAIERHPAYATIGASRVSDSGGSFLAGSDFKHHHYVVVRISEGEIVRDGATEHVFGDSNRYIEVALSESQWATFVSTLNMGCGTSCTLQWRNGEPVPEIDRSQDGKRTDRFKTELSDRLNMVESALATLAEQIEATPLSTVKKKELTRTLDRAKMNLTQNLGWVAKIFGEHVENTIEKAKTEVSAYVSAMVARAGLKALNAEAPFTMIEAKPDKPDAIQSA